MTLYLNYPHVAFRNTIRSNAKLTSLPIDNVFNPLNLHHILLEKLNIPSNQHIIL